MHATTNQDGDISEVTSAFTTDSRPLTETEAIEEGIKMEVTIELIRGGEGWPSKTDLRVPRYECSTYVEPFLGSLTN